MLFGALRQTEFEAKPGPADRTSAKERTKTIRCFGSRSTAHYFNKPLQLNQIFYSNTIFILA